jgi:hypothetical protein
LAVEQEHVRHPHGDTFRGVNKRGKGKSPVLNRIDQALRNAKNTKKMVTFTLAVETPHTEDENCTVSGWVVEVDQFDILLDLGTQREIWFKRSAIISTEIHK